MQDLVGPATCRCRRRVCRRARATRNRACPRRRWRKN